MRVVVIGGGTGSFTVLRGLKSRVEELCAVVSMFDSGGSTGLLRDEFGILPPGDVRRCLVALADENDILRKLFMYRFDEHSSLKGHSFGNLFLTALTEVTGSEKPFVRLPKFCVFTAGCFLFLLITATLLLSWRMA
ncbi:MAG: YvcK family protein [Candidatus Woesearchaeota archaeon]|nr:YvcK family protein [Candidatus Woesearchaeota archaeon]